MSWRFRQSFTVVPGLRLNLSKNGLSASIGTSPFTLNVGPHGVSGTASIPGTGLSWHEQIRPTSHLPSPSEHLPLGEQRHPFGTHTTSETAVVEQIHSASTELLTSTSLKQVKSMIQNASQQYQSISTELIRSRTMKVEAEIRFDKWNNGFLLKHLLKNNFEKRKDFFETETAKVAELEEQLKLSSIATIIDIEREQAELYYRLRDEFAGLCECTAIWDIKTRQPTDMFHERTSAHSRLSRESVQFALGASDLIQWDQKVPNLKNAKGGDFFLYPGFILYRTAREAFSLIEYQDVNGLATTVSFIEEERMPSDSVVIGQTWAKCNKDGSRDKRFAENHQYR